MKSDIRIGQSLLHNNSIWYVVGYVQNDYSDTEYLVAQLNDYAIDGILRGVIFEIIANATWLTSIDYAPVSIFLYLYINARHGCTRRLNFQTLHRRLVP